MTKRDLIEEVAQHYPRFSRRDAEVMVNAAVAFIHRWNELRPPEVVVR